MPVDIIRSSVNQIIKFGKVLRPILGISFAPDQSVQEVGLISLASVCLDSYPFLNACFSEPAARLWPMKISGVA